MVIPLLLEFLLSQYAYDYCSEISFLMTVMETAMLPTERHEDVVLRVRRTHCLENFTIKSNGSTLGNFVAKCLE
jgi:hypothetical protein